MADKILAKDKLADFLGKLQADYEVYAPQEVEGKAQWAPLEDAGKALWEFSNTSMSPKDFFFPQTEVLMRFKNVQDHESGMVMEAEPPLDKKRLLLNIRPCDAKAFQVLDLIFVQDEMTNDLYWKDKRDMTTLVGLACSDPCPSCFCTSMNCGPASTTGLDALLFDLGDKLLVRSLTEKGEAVAEGLDDAAEGDTAAAAEQATTAEGKISSSVGMDNVNSRSVMELYEAGMWDRVFENCLNCGTCTYVCPTCHCFDIQDETQGTEGRRVRNWDNCMSWLFTMHGTGHNPRGTKKDRVRQRFMHKFKYIPVKRGGEIGCVGCGRCVVLCPVNIDVRRVVNDMNA
ncbi:MAG: 4Fe-4S dicluster domain-containing protein [Desulfarculaceae bacterium]|nr:4Fe-4S dicluster domain-containing protein [Desulfarculaceae bacterium]